MARMIRIICKQPDAIPIQAEELPQSKVKIPWIANLLLAGFAL
jgi:hypothetical protein